MTAPARPQLNLSPVYLLIAALPLVVYILSDRLLQWMGDSAVALPFVFAEYDGHREAAARLQVIGAFLIVTAGAIAAIWFAINTIRLLDKISAIWAAGTFAALILLGLLTLQMPARQVQDNMGAALVCAALGYDAPRTEDERAKARREMPPPKGVEVERRDIRRGDICPARRSDQLHRLIGLERLALLLALAALAVGSICCLAGLPDGKPAKEKKAVIDEQSDRLNTYLYLSALLLVGGLFFLLAFLRWPAHALANSTTYSAHAEALAVYCGIAFSILIASFYVPVAGLVSRRAREVGGTPGDGPPAGFKGTIQLLKIAAAIGSTTFAAALTAAMGIGS